MCSTSLCRLAGKPPVGQNKQCSTKRENFSTNKVRRDIINYVPSTMRTGDIYSGKMHNQANNTYSGKNHSLNILAYGVLTSDCKTISFILSACFSFSFCISVDVRFCFLATPYKSVSPDKFFSTTFTESLGVFDFLSGVRVSQGLTKFTESIRVFEILTGVFFWIDDVQITQSCGSASTDLSRSPGNTLPNSFGKNCVVLRYFKLFLATVEHSYRVFPFRNKPMRTNCINPVRLRPEEVR